MNSSKVIFENGNLQLEKDIIPTQHENFNKLCIVKNQKKLNQLIKAGINYDRYNPEMLKLILDGDYYKELINYKDELKTLLQEVVDKKVPLYKFGNNTKFFKLAQMVKKGQPLILESIRDKEFIKTKKPQKVENECLIDDDDYDDDEFDVRPELIGIVKYIQIQLSQGNMKGAMLALQKIPKNYPEYKVIYKNILSY